MNDKRSGVRESRSTNHGPRKFAIGIDLGGTNIGAALVNNKGKVLCDHVVPTHAEEGKTAVIKRMADLAHFIQKKSGVAWKDIAGIGVGAPGPANLTKGILYSPPNLPGWTIVPLKQLLQKLLPVPVLVENDANAAAYGEYWAGTGKKAGSFALLTLGTGIGGGLVLDGKVWHGAHDTGAEFGHISIKCDGVKCACGSIGCVEAYASAPSTVRRMIEAVKNGAPSKLAETIQNGKTITAKDIATAAKSGDATAREILADTGRYLAYAIVILIHSINPERVVLTGGMIAAGDLIMKPLVKTVRERTYPKPALKTKISFSSLGDEAGIIGAAGCALAKFG